MISNSFVLGAVLTVKEVSVMWKKSQKTVMMAIYKDHILARQAAFGRTWLISKASVFKLWGNPTLEALDNER